MTPPRLLGVLRFQLILYDIAYGNNTLVIVGNSWTILTSSDGASLTSRTSRTSNTTQKYMESFTGKTPLSQ